MSRALSSALAMALVRELARAPDDDKAEMLANFKRHGVDENGNQLPISLGRNAAKRAARALIHKGPAKTAKGRRGK